MLRQLRQRHARAAPRPHPHCPRRAARQWRRHGHAAAASAPGRRAPGRVWHAGEALTHWGGGQRASADYDVVVVGAGVVGCALAREASPTTPPAICSCDSQPNPVSLPQLSQYELRVLLLDAKHDVGEGTSKANAAIVHTGFDATPGSLESELVVAASKEWPAMAARLQIPFRECGAVLVARDEEQAQQLPEIHAKAVANGVADCVRVLTAAEVLELEPHTTPDVRGGLLVGREGVADPFTTVVAYAEVAVANGVDLSLGTALAEGLAACGATVHLTAPTLPAAEGLRDELMEATGSEEIHAHACDLRRFRSIRELASGFAIEFDSLDVLIHSAEQLPLEHRLGEDGVEAALGLMLGGSFLLPALLLPHLAAEGGGQIIHVGSPELLMVDAQTSRHFGTHP